MEISAVKGRCATPKSNGVFCSAILEENDWGKIIRPVDGGGRTTSVSIMQRSGIRKMFGNWIAVLNDEQYIRFFERVNKGAMRPTRG